MTEGSKTGSYDASLMPEDALTLGFMNLPEMLLETRLDDPKLQTGVVSFLSVDEALKGIKNRSRDMKSLDSKCAVLPRSEGSPSHEPAVLTANLAVIMFASHGSFGVVDPGLLRRILAIIICLS